MQSEVSVKVYLHRSNDVTIHRFRGSYTFRQLNSIVSHLWSSAPRTLVLEYVDPEGDMVLVASEMDWAECLRLHVAACPSDVNALKIHVRRQKKHDDSKSAPIVPPLKLPVDNILADDANDDGTDVEVVAAANVNEIPAAQTAETANPPVFCRPRSACSRGRP